jgi:Uma2 family endonuclease
MATATIKTFQWLVQALDKLAPGARLLATEVPWAVYDRLVRLRDNHPRRTGVKITFDRGRLELMSPSFRHERPHYRLSLIVLALAEERDVEVVAAGATTLRSEYSERGLEPDACFYIAHAADVIELDEIDVTIHPPPDLAIEVDVTHDSVPKEPIYAALGIPEIWRYDEGVVTIRRHRTDGTYRSVPKSRAQTGVASKDLAALLAAGGRQGEIGFYRRCRAWAKTVTP